MVILIGGESHTGKTRMAQRLIEKYRYACMSLDHLKMGLIRGLPDCGFCAADPDDVISAHMWGIVRGIIQTCLENRQNIILEGCYLPPESMHEVLCPDVVLFYIIFSKEYIKNHFDQIIRYENVIEQRLYRYEEEMDAVILQHESLKARCERNDLPYFVIHDDYVREMQKIEEQIDAMIKKRL